MERPAPPPPPPSGTPPSAPPPGGRGDANQWAALIHLTMLAGFLVPVLGLAAPIGIWLGFRDEYPSLTAHAYVVFNWILSLVVYGLISFVLVFVLIGVLGFMLLTGLTIGYAIYGAIRASEGELWEYPGSIRFLK